MTRITAESSLQEIAAIVSTALESAGIPAVLGGGGAVTHYSENEYMSTDLDFITVARNKVIAPVVAELGFCQEGKDFYHPESTFFLEFPPGPLSFGDQYVDSSQTTTLKSKYGSVRIITPTQCVMDRLVWFKHGNDPQAREQAVMVAKRNQIDWDGVRTWAKIEGISDADIRAIRYEAGASS